MAGRTTVSDVFEMDITAGNSYATPAIDFRETKTASIETHITSPGGITGAVLYQKSNSPDQDIWANISDPVDFFGPGTCWYQSNDFEYGYVRAVVEIKSGAGHVRHAAFGRGTY